MEFGGLGSTLIRSVEMTKAHNIKNLSDFLRYLENGIGKVPFTIYRGQQEDWPLLPSLARCDLMDGTPDDVERRMFADFMRAAPIFVSPSPENEWDWLAIAQHHRLSTRLLDWTKNPLCALWFAVSKPASASTNYGVVWVFTPEDQDIVRDIKGRNSQFDRSVGANSPFGVPRTMVFEPRYITARIRAQEGLFTVHRFSESDKRFVPLEKIKTYRGRLEKLLIPASSFVDLRRQLLSCGVHSGSLFPDLDGLASSLKMKYIRSTDMPIA